MAKIITRRRQWRHRFAKDYHNPLFDRQTTGGRVKIYLASAGLILLVLIYGLLTNAKFNLTNLEIKGNRKITTNQLWQLFNEQKQQNWLGLFKQENYFLFSSKKLSQKIINSLEVSQAEVEKKFPNQLKISLVERAISLKLRVGETGYYLDPKGLVFAKLPYTQLETGPALLVVDTTDELTLESSPLSAEMFAFIMGANRQLRQNGLEIVNFNLKELSDRDLKVITKEGWYVLLDVREDLVRQTNNLKLLLQNKLTERTNLQYIDLRFGDKIFYK
ncbi:MAG: FtsQ-type POTRA domain-containing protein [Candidatus Buchananbacteria bacterium]